MVTRLVALVLLVLAGLPGVAEAACSGPGGNPFNCDAATSPLTGSEIFQGGQNSQAVKITLPEIAAYVTANLPPFVNLSISGNLSVGGNGTFGGAVSVGGAFSAGSTASVGSTLTVGSGSQNKLTVTPGAASTNLITLAQSGTGGFTFGFSSIQAQSIYTGMGGTFTYTVNQSAANPLQFAQLETFNLGGTISSGSLASTLINIPSDTVAMTTDGQAAWWKIIGNYGGTPWAPSTAYTVNARRANNQNLYQETAASCTSAGSGGPSGTGSGIVDGTCLWNYVGKNGSGNRAATYAIMGVPSNVAPGGSGNNNMLAGSLTTIITANQGGISLLDGQTSGLVYSGSDQLWCEAGATFLTSCVGREIDVGIFAGASAQNRYGLNIVSYGDVQATNDAGITFGAILSAADPTIYAPGFLRVVQFTNGSADETNGTLMGFSPPPPGRFAAGGYPAARAKAAYGVDLAPYLFSGAAWRSGGGATISPAGYFSTGVFSLSTSGATTTLDVPGSVITGVAVNNGGNSYRSTDYVYDNLGGVYTVTVGGGGAVTALAQTAAKGAVSGAPPCTTNCTLYYGTGSALTADFTWTAGTTMNIGTSSATAINIGNGTANTVIGSGSALATSATTGFLQIATMAGAPSGTVGAAGKAAVVIDTTNKKLCYSTGGGTWECSAAFTP